MDSLTALKSKRILAGGKFVDGFVFIQNGKIHDLAERLYDDTVPVKDFGNNVLMPGIIDAHLHINEPGRTDWEGFETATAAAAAGGITTLIEMPLNASPVTISSQAFLAKQKASSGKLKVDCGFYGGLVPQNIPEIKNLIASGVFGLKAFLIHSGIDEFPSVTESELRQGMQVAQKYNRPVLVHCELPGEEMHTPASDPQSYRSYLRSRPCKWENDAIRLVIKLCGQTGARVHIVHLSSAEALDMIADAKAEGLPVTVETVPHYIYFNSDEVPDGATHYKCAPPIREKENNQRLIAALKSGLIDFIGSDHSPAPPGMKQVESGNFFTAWGGIAGLQFLLPATWTALKDKGISVADISRLLSESPSTFLGLQNERGFIEKGQRANLVVWDPAAEFKVTSESIFHKHKITPYLGRNLIGKTIATYLNGEEIYSNGILQETNLGKVLLAH